LAIAFDNSTSQDNFSVSYTDPYYTNDGISRNVRAFIRNTDTSELTRTADYIIDSYGAKVRYGVPISEFSSFSFGFGYEHVEAIETDTTPEEVSEFIERFGSEYDLFDVSLGFTHDTRNRTVFATSGARNSINLELTTPNSDLAYLKVGYNFEYFYALTERYTLSFSTRINYGEGEDGLDELPFFRRFFAGGIQSVRGYRTNSLGPREPATGDAVGGDFRTLGTLELIFPPPFVETAGATRLSIFTDFGNVFRDVSEFDADELRGSYGLAFVWLAPIGPLTFSIANTFNTATSDNEQSFQFTIGSIF
jgi:outer membrane protein insertion porin family